MDGIFSRWNPGESSVTASRGDIGSNRENPRGADSRDNDNLNNTSEEPSHATLPGMSLASSIRPLSAHKNPGHAHPGKSREDPSESAIQPPAGTTHQQEVDNDEPYILFNGAEEYIVAQKVPGLVGLDGIYKTPSGRRNCAVADITTGTPAC